MAWKNVTTELSHDFLIAIGNIWEASDTIDSWGYFFAPSSIPWTQTAKWQALLLTHVISPPACLKAANALEIPI